MPPPGALDACVTCTPGGALQRLLERGDGRAIDVWRDRGDRTGEIGALLRTVTHRDDLLQRDRDRSHRHVERDRGAGAHRDREIGRGIAQPLRMQLVRARGDVGREVLAVLTRSCGRLPSMVMVTLVSAAFDDASRTTPEMRPVAGWARSKLADPVRKTPTARRIGHGRRVSHSKEMGRLAQTRDRTGR